ncbi:MAG: FMN-binding negative transcriptional regulator [Gammaproteobacteria bacterium]|nr:FMN-binding negative transcriptional regulator [Gammaproteobacteria bacterium]MCL5980156.1 FMN-binding negative transcriptional regulator [Gammaproteobacteria bacterium]
MYCLEAFTETRPVILRALIQQYPLATLVSTGAQGLEANHIPLYLAPGEGPQPVRTDHSSAPTSRCRGFHTFTVDAGQPGGHAS